MSTVDLTKGYWQVALLPDAKKKTTFAAPLTFQRLMDLILQPQQHYVTAYLDYVIVQFTLQRCEMSTYSISAEPTLGNVRWD